VIDAYRFRIIRDSWQKTDKRDAANLSLALWLASRSGEMKLRTRSRSALGEPPTRASAALPWISPRRKGPHRNAGGPPSARPSSSLSALRLPQRI